VTNESISILMKSRSKCNRLPCAFHIVIKHAILLRGATLALQLINFVAVIGFREQDSLLTVTTVFFFKFIQKNLYNLVPRFVSNIASACPI
jgi:hypothetical protein